MKAISFSSMTAMNRIGRRSLLGSIAVLTMGGAALRVHAADAGDPTTPIHQLNAALLAAMKAGRNTPFSQRFTMLSAAVEQAFDLNAVLRAAIGLIWISLPADQQAALASAFRQYTVSNYTANFDTYTGQNFRVLPGTRTLPNGDVIVPTGITRPNNTPVEIDYLMRQTGGAWKAVDVLSDGTISQVAVQRSDFRGLLTSGGAAALRAELQRKVATLSNGSMT